MSDIINQVTSDATQAQAVVAPVVAPVVADAQAVVAPVVADVKADVKADVAPVATETQGFFSKLIAKILSIFKTL
jgi:hypothetical protein